MLSSYDISGFTADDIPQNITPAYVPISSHQMTRLGRIVRYGRWWAVKSLSPDCPDEFLGRSLLEKEFQILISISHPHVLRAMELTELPGLGLCIIMEYIDGADLCRWLDSSPSLKMRRNMAVQILSTFAYLQRKGVNHRDIKPENLMVDSEGNLKVIDFGLGDRADFAFIKHVTGTPEYAAPELASDGEADICRAEVYSIGKVLDLLNLGRSWRNTIRKATAVSPERRPANAETLMALRRRHVMVRTGVVVILFCLAAALAAFLFLPQQSPNHQNVKMLNASAKTPETSADTLTAAPKTPDAAVAGALPETVTPRKEHSAATTAEAPPSPETTPQHQKVESPTSTLIIALLKCSEAWSKEKYDSSNEGREFDYNAVAQEVAALRATGVKSGWSKEELRIFDRNTSSDEFRNKGAIGSLAP